MLTWFCIWFILVVGHDRLTLELVCTLQNCLFRNWFGPRKIYWILIVNLSIFLNMSNVIMPICQCVNFSSLYSIIHILDRDNGHLANQTDNIYIKSLQSINPIVVQTDNIHIKSLQSITPNVTRESQLSSFFPMLLAATVLTGRRHIPGHPRDSSTRSHKSTGSSLL